MNNTFKKQAETPVVGVTSLNRLKDWVYDKIDQGIDLSYESVLEEITAEVNAEYEAGHAGPEHDDTPEESISAEIERRMEHWEPCSDSASVLIGDWKRDAEGLYTPDHNGSQGFAAHYMGFCGGVISIEWSRWTKRCNQTSPCFVMADGRGTCGDLDTAGSMRLAYSLPPDWFETEPEV